MSTPRRLGSTRGFSLTEAAIVLAIISFLVALIWKTVLSSKTEQMVQTGAIQTTQLVQNIGRLFLESRTMTQTGSYNALLLNAGAFPADMLNEAGNPITPWNSTITVYPDTSISGIADHYYITFPSFPSEELCRKFIGRIAETMGSSTLKQVKVGAVTYNGASFPKVTDLTATNASGCSQFANPTYLYFKLKG